MAKQITQSRLSEYLKMKEVLAEEKAVLEIELGEGAEVELGDISASISTSDVVRPDWKAAFLERCGEVAVDEVIDNTPSKPQKKMLIRAKKKTIPMNKEKKRTKEEIDRPLTAETIAKLSMFGEGQ
jgi:hypothetical protein